MINASMEKHMRLFKEDKAMAEAIARKKAQVAEEKAAAEKKAKEVPKKEVA